MNTIKISSQVTVVITTEERKHTIERPGKEPQEHDECLFISMTLGKSQIGAGRLLVTSGIQACLSAAKEMARVADQFGVELDLNTLRGFIVQAFSTFLENIASRPVVRPEVCQGCSAKILTTTSCDRGAAPQYAQSIGRCAKHSNNTETK